jgi:hypothetical protein
MAESGYVFTTIAFRYKTGRPLWSAGFFCLWDNDLTFIHSKYVQFVTPLPLIGGHLPDDVKPVGPEDPRTRFRIPYADLTQVSKKKALILVQSRNERDLYFGGGSVNPAFKFDAVAAELTGALEAAGYMVTVADDVLTVQHGAG